MIGGTVMGGNGRYERELVYGIVVGLVTYKLEIMSWRLI